MSMDKISISKFEKPPVFSTTYSEPFKPTKHHTKKLKQLRKARKVAEVKWQQKRRQPVSQEQWLAIHREHKRWQKTEDYAKWRYKQFLKQGGTCYYCDEPLSGTRTNDEHVIPKILGGDNRRSNLVLACWKCNKDKYTQQLSYKQRQLLKEKNRKKRGTYLKLKEQFKSETDMALELRDMFRED